MEEEGREVLKHLCKFCSKSFPCGRSLGGHMRSHITNVSAEAEEKLTKKIQPFMNGGAGSSSKFGEYDLRENPKKSWRFADSSRTEEEEEAPLVDTEDKFCKECGKAFHSWKALFGHMKCHSEKASINNNKNNLENQDSASHKAVTDSQSDNEGTGNNPNRRRRSKRRRTRLVTTASTSSLSFVNPSSSVSEVEQEQEEVAMSLMMLSRDVGHWGGLNSLVESSDNNSAYFEARSYVVRTNLSSKTETAKVKLTIGSNSDSENLNSKVKKSESLATGSALNGLKAIKATVSINGLVKNCKEKKHHELDNQSTLEESDQDEQANGTELDSSAKRRFSDSDQVKSNFKKGKFKCTTCNKIFHSYQALGGHRSSHKKLKGCSASRNDQSSENSIETDLNNGYVIENQQELIIGGSVNFENEEGIVTTEPKKNKVHECPICLKIFSSGQALGGHKRSHFAAEGSSLVLEKPVDQEIRDFLDLNLPASAEEESNSTQVENYPPPPWWHPNQEPLVGLISN